MVQEILDGGELAEFRQRALEQGLAAVRRTRARRRVVRWCGMGLPVLILAGLFLAHGTRLAQVQQPSPANTQVALANVSQSRGNQIQFINDEQLFALFPGRSMALIGKPGHQQLVFLDGGKPKQ
jgi:hypothetical protein